LEDQSCFHAFLRITFGIELHGHIPTELYMQNATPVVSTLFFYQ